MIITESYISLDEMTFFARHGVLSQEKITGNTYHVNLRMKVDFLQAVLTDELSATVNYAEIYQLVKEEMEIPSQLIEHVAGRIVQRLFDEFPQIETIDLTLSKVNPPLGGDLHSASVELHSMNPSGCPVKQST